MLRRLMSPKLPLRTVIAVLSAALVCGCPGKTNREVDAGVARIETPPPVVDAGPPQPPPLQLTVQFATDAGMQTVDFVPGDKPIAPQTDRIQLDLNQRVSNYRIRLFDEADKAVPSDDSPDELPGSLRYTIGLQAPLRTGFRYALVLDAQTGAAMMDATGRPLSDVRLEFRVAGEKEKPKPEKKPAKKKRH